MSLQVSQPAQSLPSHLSLDNTTSANIGSIKQAINRGAAFTLTMNGKTDIKVPNTLINARKNDINNILRNLEQNFLTATEAFDRIKNIVDPNTSSAATQNQQQTQQQQTQQQQTQQQQTQQQQTQQQQTQQQQTQQQQTQQQQTQQQQQQNSAPSASSSATANSANANASANSVSTTGNASSSNITNLGGLLAKTGINDFIDTNGNIDFTKLVKGQTPPVNLNAADLIGKVRFDESGQFQMDVNGKAGPETAAALKALKEAINGAYGDRDGNVPISINPEAANTREEDKGILESGGKIQYRFEPQGDPLPKKIVINKNENEEEQATLYSLTQGLDKPQQETNPISLNILGIKSSGKHYTSGTQNVSFSTTTATLKSGSKDLDDESFWKTIFDKLNEKAQPQVEQQQQPPMIGQPQKSNGMGQAQQQQQDNSIINRLKRWLNNTFSNHK